jgi:PAS domain S-box-containing protein
VDVEGRFTFVNQAAKRIYGYEPTETMGRCLTDFVFGELESNSAETSNSFLERLRVDSDLNIQWETVHRHRDGTPVYLSFNAIALWDELGNFQGATGTASDITEHKQSETALKQAKDRLQAVLDAVPWFVSWLSSDLRYIGVNRQLAESFNLTPEEFIDREIGFLDTGPDFVQFMQDFFASSKQQVSREVDTRVNGEIKYYLIVTQKYDEGKAAVSVGIDISDRKRAEAMQAQLIASLQESERKFRSLYEATSDAVMLLDEEGFLFDCNRATLEMFSFQTKEKLCGKHPKDISPPFQGNGQDTESSIKTQIAIALETGNARFEWFHRKLDGTEFPAEVLLTAMEFGKVPNNSSNKIFGGTKVLQAVVRDITERKRDEDKIKAALAEKEVLLKEIHHRVKNNLQVISSLLRLQSRYIQDRTVLEMLKESQNRVRSMALVHEHLYQSQDLSRIDFAEYIQNLASNLFQAYQVNARGVKLKIEVAPTFLNIDTAVPCGLIINELVSNSLKYAFKNRNSGELTIEFARDDKDLFLLTVRDNGRGFPPNIDYKNSGSLGLRLVCSLVRQLRGNIELKPGCGTIFQISFPSSLRLA